MNILAISGSLRKESINYSLLRAAQALAPDGVTVTIHDYVDVPLYNGDVEQASGIPAGVTTLAEAIRSADGLLIATPEYNQSMPGVLKNALDWVSRVDSPPIKDKPVAIMGATPGSLGTRLCQAHLRQTLLGLNAYVLKRPEIFVSQAGGKIKDGEVTDETTRTLIGNLMSGFATWIKQVQSFTG